MHIGLIGGIGPAATDLYYRGLIDEMKRRSTPLEATIVHADAPTLVANFEARAPEVQASIFARLTERLKSAGAEAVAITSIGGHFCVNEFRPLSALPVLPAPIWTSEMPATLRVTSLPTTKRALSGTHRTRHAPRTR